MQITDLSRRKQNRRCVDAQNIYRKLSSYFINEKEGFLTVRVAYFRFFTGTALSIMRIAGKNTRSLFQVVFFFQYMLDFFWIVCILI